MSECSQNDNMATVVISGPVPCVVSIPSTNDAVDTICHRISDCPRITSGMMEISSSHGPRQIAPVTDVAKAREGFRRGSRRGSHRGSSFAALFRQRKSSWRRSGILVKRMLQLSSISNGAALFCAVVYGTANPFLKSYAGDATTREGGVRGTATMMAFYLPFSGIICSCALFAFFIRGRFLRTENESVPYRPLTFTQSWWIAVRLTWKLAVTMIVLSVVVTQALFAAGFPVVKYNLHSHIGMAGVVIHSVHAISQVARFRQTRTGSLTVPVHVRRWSGTASSTDLQPIQRLHRNLRVGLANVFPPLLAAVAGMQYVTLGRTLHLEDRQAIAAFAAGSLLLKFFLQVVAKLVAVKAKSASDNIRNRLYMILSPILIIDISLRLAMLRLSDNSSSLYAGSIFLGVSEILIRVLTVLFDRAVIVIARRKVERKKRELLQRQNSSSLLSVLPRRAVAPSGALTEACEKALVLLDTEFETWRSKHLHLCAVEVMAEMVAEYCSIGFACIYMIVLHNNPAFDLGTKVEAHTTHEWTQLVTTQLKLYLVQLVIEVCSDVIGGSFEIHMGIHVDEACEKGELAYIQWTVLVVAMHAGGLSLSSLLTTGRGANE